MLKTIRHLLELVRFSHTLFALPFALLAAVMAWAAPRYIAHGPPAGVLGSVSYVEGIRSFTTFGFAQLLGLLLCMVTARSFAMAFNRLADRRIDAGNPRDDFAAIPLCHTASRNHHLIFRFQFDQFLQRID